jgi:guanylate kinase
MKRKLIIVSAPSGAGKTTIVRALLERFPELEFSISACSRDKRPGEKDGKDYYFISPEAFRKKIEAGEFLEWEEVYKDHYYGTLKSELERIWAKGKQVIFDVDVVGGLNIKKQFPEHSISIFIQAPTMEILEQRLRERATESEDKLRQRIDKSRQEMAYADRFDTVVVNDKLEEAIQDAVDKVSVFLRE